ncbi:hypothetical protein evm_002679 [Chilo suppressalis]|nr:hypothetical protein evm_002679 [Chilo suppressalis]
MSLQCQPYSGDAVSFDKKLIERVILELADMFHIRVVFDWDTAVMTGAFALAGGLIGGYAGGRVGAALGAGIGGVTGLGVSSLESLREIWFMVKEKLKELLYIVFNYLRRLDPVDIEHGLKILMACATSKKELVFAIVEFITYKLGKEVVSSITAA